MTREEQILDRLSQVRLIAAKIHRRLPAKSVPLDDLVSAGMLGLIAAVNRYDPAIGTELKSYAEFKIRGAILDSLRELDPCSRHARRYAKRAAAATAQLEQELERSPDEEEIAARLGVPLAKHRGRRWREADAAQVLSIHQPIDQKRTYADVLRSLELGPDALAAVDEQAHAIARAMRILKPRERAILLAYYWDGLTLRAIAKRLDVNESRVSQIKNAALAKLRAQLAGAAGVDKLAA